MNNISLKTIVIVILLSSVVATFGHIALSELTGSSVRLQAYRFFHKAEYERISKELASEEGFQSVTLPVGYIQNETAINSCAQDSTVWVCYAKTVSGKNLILPSQDAVLEYFGITQATFDETAKFMHRRHIGAIGIDEARSYIEMRDKEYGLRYYFDPAAQVQFSKDEYSFVKQLDAQWYMFYSDY
jgi:hypothetical protein